jgi:hypothetical protein
MLTGETKMLKILSAKTIARLEKEAEGYDIKELGSFTISNGHYFLSFLGEPKVNPSLPKEEKPAIEETKVNPSLPNVPSIAKHKPTRRKRKPNV